MVKRLSNTITRFDRERLIATLFHLWCNNVYKNRLQYTVDEMFVRFKKSKDYREIPTEIRESSSLTERGVILNICAVFGLPNDKWIDSKSLKAKDVVPRQVLMTILVDRFKYSLADAGAYCGRSHCNALHAKKRVYETLMNDGEYGEKVRSVFNHCQKVKNLRPKKRKLAP